jgi:hypothetical protein
MSKLWSTCSSNWVRFQLNRQKVIKKNKRYLQIGYCSTKCWTVNPKWSTIFGDSLGLIVKFNFDSSFTKISICGNQKMKNDFFMQRKWKLSPATFFVVPSQTILCNIYSCNHPKTFCLPCILLLFVRTEIEVVKGYLFLANQRIVSDYPRIAKQRNISTVEIHPMAKIAPTADQISSQP